MMDRKEIATAALEDAAYAVRREEITASRKAGETISCRQPSSCVRFPALGDAERYYFSVSRVFSPVFGDFEEAFDAKRTGSNRAETEMGEPVTNRVP